MIEQTHRENGDTSAEKLGGAGLRQKARPGSAGQSATMKFSAGAEIYGEGEPAEYLYQVITGTIRTSRFLVDGRRQIGGFYLSGDIFGLDPGDVHSYLAEAIVDSRVVAIKRSTVLGLAARDGEIARQLWALMWRELSRAQAHVLLLVQSAQERVAGFLLEMARRLPESDAIDLPMSRQDIADYLGLSMETVSRMLTNLESEAAIALPSSRRIVLCNRPALSEMNA